MQEDPEFIDEVDGPPGISTDEMENAHGSTNDLELTKTTLVEISPGMAVVLGQVPDGLQLVDFGVVPAFDRVQLNQALGSVGNLATISGNLAEAATSAQGLFRVNDATLSLLKSGAEMAAKDGAKLGAIFQNGELVAQARFIPATMTAGAAVAAIGPAIAMLALQMQLGEVSSLVRENIALTSDLLKTIQHDQWAELTGLSVNIERAVSEATRVQAVSSTTWESVSGDGSLLEKQLDQYRRNVGEHTKQLSRVHEIDRCRYLENHAEAILFDTNALLVSLEAHTGYQALRAARARSNAETSADEARLVEVITADTREQFEISMSQTARLVKDLTRELRIIAELPGRAALPLSKKRRASKASQLTCQQLLDAIHPLADALNPSVEQLWAPTVSCVPEGIDLDQYLHVLRWFLEDDESLSVIAFAHEPGAQSLANIIPAALGPRIDATWSAIKSNKRATVIDKIATPTLVAVTDQRIISASPRSLAHRGKIRDSIPLDEVKFVRTQSMQTNAVRPTVDIITADRNVRWMFPEEADPEHIDLLSQVIDAGREDAQPIRSIPEGEAKFDSNRVPAEVEAEADN